MQAVKGSVGDRSAGLEALSGRNGASGKTTPSSIHREVRVRPDLGKDHGYGPKVRQLGPGLFASTVPFSYSDTKSYLREAAQNETFRLRSRCLARASSVVLGGIVHVLEALEASPEGFLHLRAAWDLLHKDSLELRQFNRTQWIRQLLAYSPLSATVVSPTADKKDDYTVLLPRPQNASVLQALIRQLQESVASESVKRRSRVASLPLGDLQILSGSTQTKKVLNSAVAHLVGIKSLATNNAGVSRATIRNHVQQTDKALQELPALLEKVATALETEREMFQKRYTAALEAAEHCDQIGKVRAADDFQKAAMIAVRKAEIRNVVEGAWAQKLRRELLKEVSNLPALQHLPRGHMTAIEVKYPNFKPAIETVFQDLSARADSRRYCVKIQIGKGTWSEVCRRIADGERMESLGGAIHASVSTLKKNKARPERSRQPKAASSAGALDVSKRVVAKILMPTELEQPNGYIANKVCAACEGRV
jgi:hypothetical protein